MLPWPDAAISEHVRSMFTVGDWTGSNTSRCLAKLARGRCRLLVIATAFGAATCCAGPHPAQADEAKLLAYGRHLASECAACHRIDGVDNGIPSITGWRPADFVATLDFYRTGARPNQVMVSVVQSLDENQIKALAAYYGSLPKPARK